MAMRAAARRRAVRQFHHPSGLLGRLAGWVMSHRASNVERNRWAVEQLDVQPADRVMEIGFGPGVAIEALAGRVTRGTVYGVDHSDLMVRMASRRNAAAVADGRVVLMQAEVTGVPDTLGPLDLVLAVNNLGMWPDPAVQLARLRELLRPGGRMAVGSQPRSPDADAETARRSAEQIATMLVDAGFGSIETRRLDLDPPMMLVIGRRPADPR